MSDEPVTSTTAKHGLRDLPSPCPPRTQAAAGGTPFVQQKPLWDNNPRVKGYPLISKTTSFRERFVNDVMRVEGERKVIEKLDAACYSHSPPDHPLAKYNRYRKNKFDKSLVNIHNLVALKIPANRDEYFANEFHRRFPEDGSLESILEYQRAKANRHRRNLSKSMSKSVNESTVRQDQVTQTDMDRDSSLQDQTKSGRWFLCCCRKKRK